MTYYANSRNRTLVWEKDRCSFGKSGATCLFIVALAFLTVSAQNPFPAELPSASAGETAELNLYRHETQIGIIARRTIRDRTDRIAREVFYSSTAAGLVPPTVKDLRVRSISVYYYDAKGRVDHIEHWEVGRRVPRVEHNAYDSSGELSRKWFLERDGVRRYEMRFKDASTIAELYFDDTGAYLTSLRGQLVSDVDLPHGWGTTSHGMACGITLTTERGRFDKIGVWVNIKNVAAESLKINNLGPPSFELHDAGGKTIPMLEAGSAREHEFEKSPPYLNGQLLDQSEAGHMYPAYSLADFFDPLPPGKYTIRVRQPVPERNVTLVSNEVTFVVL